MHLHTSISAVSAGPLPSLMHGSETRYDASLIIEENSCAVFGQVHCVPLFSCFGVVSVGVRFFLFLFLFSFLCLFFFCLACFLRGDKSRSSALADEGSHASRIIEGDQSLLCPQHCGGIVRR